MKIKPISIIECFNLPGPGAVSLTQWSGIVAVCPTQKAGRAKDTIRRRLEAMVTITGDILQHNALYIASVVAKLL